MKMVKSLLLGTAAGLVAIAGAQAADLPVKAKPVQYVKICSLYGAGFYYIPGTDMCLKVGGWVRSYWNINSNGSLSNGVMDQNPMTRNTGNFTTRVRGYITMDARNQTEYGTLRSYIAVGVANTVDAASGAATVLSVNRAFIQLAGFTAGITQSFYDFYNTPALSYFGANIHPSSDTGDGGKQALAYTAQFGNGLSATISAEGRRDTSVFNNTATAGTVAGLGIFSAATTAGTTTSIAATSQEALQWPDVVANLRVDQAWGSAQIMGAIHDNSGQYYGSNGANGNTTAAGHPGNAVGYALGAGIKLNNPSWGPGDYFSAQFNYTVGASGYAHNAAGGYQIYNGGSPNGTLTFGVVADGVYGGSIACGVNGTAGAACGTNTGIEQTTAWGVNAAYEHFWNKSWQTSLYGAYVKYQYSNLANAMLCASEGVGTGIGTQSTINSGTTCNNNWGLLAVGTRTQWNIDSTTYLGIDIIYQNIDGASISPTTGLQTVAFGTQPAAFRGIGGYNAFTGQFRWHRNFYP